MTNTERERSEKGKEGGKKPIFSKRQREPRIRERIRKSKNEGREVGNWKEMLSKRSPSTGGKEGSRKPSVPVGKIKELEIRRGKELVVERKEKKKRGEPAKESTMTSKSLKMGVAKE